MRMRKNKNSDENFTSLLSAIDRQAAAPDQEFLKQLRERSAREFAAGAPDVSTNTPKSIRMAALRRLIMKTPITKLATAAIVAIACLIGLSLWRGTESGIALADVLARIEQVKAYRYKWSVTITGEETPGKPINYEEHATDLISEEHGRKSVREVRDPNGRESWFGEEYYLPQKKTKIVIMPKQKKYARTEFEDMFEGLQELQDPRTSWIKEILESKYESLGRSTVDSIEVEGFQKRWDEGNPGVSTIWVDVKTRLPVRYEEDNMHGKMRTRIAQYDFQWDVPIDAAEFEPVIPDDYTRIAGIPVKMPAATEENAIKGLKLYADLSGHYRETLFWKHKWSEEIEKMDTPAAMRLKEELKGLTEDEKADRLADIMLPFNGLCRFCIRLIREGKDSAYYGKIVTPKDADKVLMRWKVSDNEYRVIFGDLHAETVTKEKLAELEAALPK